MTASTATSIFCPATLGWPLPDCGEDGPTAEQQRAVLGALRHTRVDWSVMGRHLAFDSDCYLRRRLFLSRSWEILMLCWLPGQKTAIHDHGASWGSTLVMMGELTERTYRAPGGPLEPKADATLTAGQVTVESQQTIHEVSNQGAVPAVSLHLYSPPLRFLHSYDQTSGEKRYVEPAESRFCTR
ncbi:MAG: cysteine dioxygenase family protein [Acidobacteria bacterium]|nr:cysteine dioxygenase family protein [Acidobacteriota bacterium]